MSIIPGQHDVTPLGLPSPVTLITTPADLRALAGRLASQPRVALDTEAASFHRYVDRVYLVQLSCEGETALVDPLSVPDLEPLGALLADPAIEIVIHDADYDLRILNRDYGFRARKLFDTRLAAQFVGEPAVGLASLLEKHFGVKVDKKLQRADWSRRPLTQAMIAYAADDTRYLPELRDKLERRLRELHRLAWAQEEFRHLEEIRWTQTPADRADSYLRIKGAKTLGRRQRAILRAVHGWREATARDLDRAPFRVLGNPSLLKLAQTSPTTMAQLTATAGVPKSTARRFGRSILEAVRTGVNVPQQHLPVVKRGRRPDPEPGFDQRLERLKALRNRRAEDIGMAPGLVCPNGRLQVVARSAPENESQLDEVTELRRWQREVLGDRALLSAVEGG